MPAAALSSHPDLRAALLPGFSQSMPPVDRPRLQDIPDGDFSSPVPGIVIRDRAVFATRSSRMRDFARHPCPVLNDSQLSSY